MDFFQFPITLNMNNSSKISTRIGKILSIVLLIYIINSFFTSDLILKTNPITIIQKLKPKLREKIVFGKNNFTFAIGLIDAANKFFIDETLFTFNLTIFYYDNVQNKNIYEENTELRLCNDSDFISSTDSFRKLNITGSLCLPYNSYEVDGFWDENYVKYLVVDIFRCVNSTNNNNTCKTIEEINKFIANKYVSIYVSDINLDVGDYFDPFKESVKNYYSILDSKISKLMYFYIQNVNLTTNEGFLFPEIKKKNDITMGKIEKDFNVVADHLSQEKAPYFELMIYSSDEVTVVERKYQNIQDLLAQMGGIINIFMILAFGLAQIEMNYIFTKSLSKDLYIYQDIIKKKSEKKKRKKDIAPMKKNQISKFDKTNKLCNLNQSKLNIFNIDELSNSINSLNSKNKSLDKNNFVSNQESLTKNRSDSYSSNIRRLGDSFKKTVNALSRIVVGKSSSDRNKKIDAFLGLIDKSKNSFPLDFKSYIKMIFKLKNFKLSDEEQLYIKGEQLIQSQMNIINIINGLNDIEKLKMIFLNDKQQYMFNLMSKPLICLDKKVNDKNYYQKKFIINRKKIKIDKEKFKEIYENLKCDVDSNDLNKKILEKIDIDLLKILQN